MGGIQKAWPQLIRIIPVTVVAILIFTILTVYGVMDLIGIFFEPILGAIGLPGESSTSLGWPRYSARVPGTQWWPPW